MQSKREEYKEVFLAEALENLGQINTVLTQLEKKPTSADLVNTLFRVTHTLKGNATGMGYDDIASLSHVLEDLFGEVRNNAIALSEEIFSALFKAVDVLEALTDAVKTGKKIQYRGIRTKLEVIIKKASTEKVPMSKTNAATRKKATAKKSKKKESVKTTLGENIQEAASPGNGPGEELQPANSSARITFSDLVQVPVRKIDNLLNLVGELIIERDRIAANQVNRSEYSRLDRISSDLQYAVMDVRLVQVGFLFNKFHRVVRDAANAEGKMARLELKGIDTEIDRNILQIISDSLIHLIRNAVSHGIERPVERKKKKKPEEGTITLSARNDNDGVLIEISDDGRGIDIERIKAKAISNGLVNHDMVKMINREELLMMIFEPGFSTKDEVSALSGRGVGMDVVKKAVDSIGGSIMVEAMENEGSTIKLKLPSSMAVKGTLLFILEGQTYAIPLSYTEAVVSLYKSDLHKANNGIVSTYLGRTISLVFLKDLFNTLNNREAVSKKAFFNCYDQLHPEAQVEVVIVSYNGRTIGLVVDKLLQQKEIVEKPLFKPLDHISLLSGVTILGNGEVCPVLNITTIVNLVFSYSLPGNKII